MNKPDLIRRLLKQPTDFLLSEYRKAGGTGTVTKARAATWIAEMVERGRMNEPIMGAGIPAADPAAQAVVNTANENLSKMRADIENDIRKLEYRLSGNDQSLSGINSVVNNITVKITEIDKNISSIQSAVSKIATVNGDSVAEATREAVAAAMAPFIATVQAAGPEVAAEVMAQAAGPVSRGTALDIFGVDARDARGNRLMFTTWGHADAPPVDKHHIWTERMLRYLALAEASGRNIWLGGPAGTGKTQTAQQWAARTGRLFRRFVFTRYSTADDFLGATGMVNGSTQFVPGPVLEAFSTPGSICLLDEPGVGNPAALSVLNGLLEGQARVAYGDRVWLRGASNLFVAADNSLTQGDPSGRFSGVGQMNTAFADRFGFVVPVDYLSLADEVDALIRHTSCSQDLAEHVINALTVARGKVASGDIIDPPTFRQAIAFVEALRVLPAAEAWLSTIAARQAAESQVGLAAVYAAAIDEQLISREI